MLLSVYVLFRPGDGAPEPFPYADKVVHLVLFALVAAATRWRFGARNVVLRCVVAYAVLSEVVQAVAIGSRSGDVLDVLADLVGVGIGWQLARHLP